MRSTVTRAGRSTASSFSSVRDFRLPISASLSSVPFRMTLNVPARRSSICAALTDPGGTNFPTGTFLPLVTASCKKPYRPRPMSPAAGDAGCGGFAGC
jgi:hypothetical protein